MTNFTTGPWKCRLWLTEPETIAGRSVAGVPALLNNGERTVTANGKRVAIVTCQTEFKRGYGHQTECAERDANARLIEAAPDMCAALHALLGAASLSAATGKPFAADSPGIVAARAVLARITGESP